ncbi:Hypothetical predicted protein [Lecanosticta acicola]|uniref:Uncharacterized protein n=1 Tax=Lecanosticta acicola TaxID=111012 RepID=A0AAI8Z3W0_9PEZI|nr:Hypothetical predicted protein [Lecanosticta acicola]
MRDYQKREQRQKEKSRYEAAKAAKLVQSPTKTAFDPVLARVDLEDSGYGRSLASFANDTSFTLATYATDQFASQSANVFSTGYGPGHQTAASLALAFAACYPANAKPRPDEKGNIFTYGKALVYCQTDFAFALAKTEALGQ